MTCQCGNNVIIEVVAKCDDRCGITCNDMEYDGYIPNGLSIGRGDYIEFDFCSKCGRIQGFQPLEISDIETILK